MKNSLSSILFILFVSNSYCQTISKSLTIYTTAESTNQKLSKTENINFGPAEQAKENEYSIFVNTHKSFQKIIGFGGAITDASAETFAKLSTEKQQEFLNAYFDQNKGIGYTIARTNIHSCDFSSQSYTYVNEGDKNLKSFNIDHDKAYRIPLIKQAIKASANKLLLYASPWSPPAFMKDNNNMLRGGKLLPEYYDSWANYFVKFIKSYEAEGIPVWGLTIQNEPMATQRWESCIFTSEEERDFLKFHLGPIMYKNGFTNKKIIVWDHNRDLLTQRASTIFNDSVASKYAWGIGFHWYETWTGGDPLHKNVQSVNETFPNKNIFFTEGCVEAFDASKYQFWGNAERYGKSIINDLNAGIVGWTDWNILLDETGGPNHVGNFCFAPIHADTKTGNLIYTPTYYYIGHFSKFILPNAKRISSSSSRSNLLTTSFQNENGTFTTIVMNSSNEPITYNFIVDNSEAQLSILPHAIQTIVY